MQKEIKTNQVWKNREDNIYVITGREKGLNTAMKFCNNKLSCKKMYMKDGSYINQASDFENKQLIGLLKKNFIIENKIIRSINGNKIG